MNNLHKISRDISDFLRLVAARWHLNDEGYLGRRVGTLIWDGTYLYYDRIFYNNKIADATKFLATDQGRIFKTYFESRDYISSDLYQDNMIKVVK